MKFITTSDFKTCLKQNKSIQGAIRKNYTAPVVITGERQAKFVFSSESVDRDFDVIMQDGIDITHFAANPVIFYNHEHDIPIGKCISIGIENGKLVGVVEFAPADNPVIGAKAEGIYQLCRDGFLSTTSIGFFPKSIDYPDGERLAKDGVNVLESELCEVSITGIPSNRDAMILAVKSVVREDPVIEPEPKHYRGPRLQRVLAALD